MLVLNREKIQQRLRERGMRSFSDLARKIGVHRNTLQRYLGDRSVVSECVEKVVEYLDLSVSEALIRKNNQSVVVPADVAEVVDQLSLVYPEVSFILFGSRAKGRSHKYSDFDIGVFSSRGLNLSQYLDIVELSDTLSEDLPYMIDLTNLNQADEGFLREVSKDWIFLTGRLKDRVLLESRVKQ